MVFYVFDRLVSSLLLLLDYSKPSISSVLGSGGRINIFVAQTYLAREIAGTTPTMTNCEIIGFFSRWLQARQFNVLYTWICINVFRCDFSGVTVLLKFDFDAFPKHLFQSSSRKIKKCYQRNKCPWKLHWKTSMNSTPRLKSQPTNTAVYF